MAKPKGQEVHDWEDAEGVMTSGGYIIDLYVRDGDLQLPNVYVDGVEPGGEQIRLRGHAGSFGKHSYQLFMRSRY